MILESFKNTADPNICTRINDNIRNFPKSDPMIGPGIILLWGESVLTAKYNTTV